MFCLERRPWRLKVLGAETRKQTEMRKLENNRLKSASVESQELEPMYLEIYCLYLRNFFFFFKR